MKIVKSIIILLALIFQVQYAIAQSSGVKKTAGCCFTLTTFKADGSLLSTANGVFIGADGIGVGAWTPFVGAAKATVIDAKGVRHDVECLLGADEIYNLAKFRVQGKVTAAPLATSVNNNQTVWITPSSSKGSPMKATVTSVEKFMTQYNYSVLNASATDQMNGTAVINEKGQVIGLFNASSSQKSATDVASIRDYKLVGLTQNNATLRLSTIRIGLPETESEALIAMMLASEKSPEVYIATVQEFIQKFPKATDGYNNYANRQLTQGDLAGADKTMLQSIANATAKDEAHFNYARNIYLASVNDALADKVKAQGWSLDKAMKEAEIAYSLKAANIYKHLQAQITYAKGDYNGAYIAFEALTKTDIKNSELYLEMAQSKQRLNASDDEILQLLNQSIQLCDTPYVATSAPYFFARGQQYQKMEQYRLAVKDYYTYEYFNLGRLSSVFYYNREQCEVKAKMWQQAIQDIAIAARLDPKEPLYPIEAASILLRLGKYDTAKSAAEEAIKLDPNAAEAYLVLGVSQCELKDKVEGLKNINKAKELGNAQADNFLAKYK